MDLVIYMPLLGEGTDCWRPVRAVQVAEGVFEVADQLREGESWAFAPNSRVRCRKHVFATGEQGLVAFEYAVASDHYYQLLKNHERAIFRVVFANGEEAVIRVLHVDEEYEDFRASAFRHFIKWMKGQTDEDHAAAVFFNIQGAEYVKGRWTDV